MLGIDIVDIERVKNIYRKHGELFLEKILTSEEISDLFAGRKKEFFKTLCCYIACKEAIFKACSEENLEWKEIIIRNIKTKPLISIARPTFKKIIQLSFSVNSDMAIAQAAGV
ncbi:MAG: 4'-phosphopantetheinyl transferase superfamily protein [Candidatus Omnitrophota bacterium]|nr:MAG: 4'-phosphopantetheinyl transferase superfamily protein [Candidatus Omnitrophota bacterium]